MRATKPVAGQTSGPIPKKLKKGDTLFAEGENSRAMYFLKSGMIRIYKKKGESQIEIDTIHSGQIVGELAFLDGNPRSASAEALTDVEMMEIGVNTFAETMANIPDWLKLLLKTVVGRLRTASTRIRQLESASTAVDYSSKDGKRSSHYVYLAPHEILKVCSAVLLVASRNGAPTADKAGVQIKVSTLQKYGNTVMNVPVAKITTMVDVLAQLGIMTINDSASEVIVKDVDYLERFISYLSEENQLEPSKRHDISLKGFVVMSYMAKHLSKYPADPATGLANVNLGEIRKLETAALGKEAFRLEDFGELHKLGYASQLNLKSADDVFTNIKPEEFTRHFRFQKTIKTIDATNEQKGAGRTK
jgi:CRP-like cAMP-binding protein